MARKRIVVIGAGGFAREVKWLVEVVSAAGTPYEFAGYVVSDLTHLGLYDSREEIRGDLGWLLAHREAFDALAVGIGTPASRLKVVAELETEFGEEYWPPLLHPSVILDRHSSRIGAGVIVCAGTVGTVNLALEPFCVVNLSCTLGHEARIGRGVVLNPSVSVSGGVALEEGVLVGTGARILQYLTVGRGSTVGAGAVVTKDVPPGTTVVGIPARPMAPR